MAYVEMKEACGVTIFQMTTSLNMVKAVPKAFVIEEFKVAEWQDL